MDPPGKIRTYWPDYYVEYKKRDGTIAKEIIEIKPTKDTKRSNARNPKTKKIQDIVYLTNQAKWTYAQKFCEARGLKFNIMTEKELFR